MSDYQKNIEVMAHSLALMLAPIVTLSEDDALEISNSGGTESELYMLVVNKMFAEYLNEIEICPAAVRRLTPHFAYRCALANEFNNSISDSCEQWIRRIQKDAKHD